MAKNIAILACDPLRQAIDNGTAKVKELAEIGVEHPHHIYLVKVITGTDPSVLFKPTSGAHFYMIRPSEVDGASNEGGKLWDWYLLSCPHDPPCPFM